VPKEWEIEDGLKKDPAAWGDGGKGPGTSVAHLLDVGRTGNRFETSLSTVKWRQGACAANRRKGIPKFQPREVKRGRVPGKNCLDIEKPEQTPMKGGIHRRSKRLGCGFVVGERALWDHSQKTHTQKVHSENSKCRSHGRSVLGVQSSKGRSTNKKASVFRKGKGRRISW